MTAPPPAPENLVGIDLGTTYSSLSRLDKNYCPQMVANIEGETATLSSVFFGGRGEGIVVGRDAYELGIAHPERYVANAKRFLGQPGAQWEIDNVVYTPVDISAMILQKLIQDASRYVGSIEEAVIAVPAHFTTHQRHLTVEAGLQAGLKKASVVNEPVAAALYYGMGEDGLVMTQVVDDFTVLVFDLGGGTCDLSLVRYGTEPGVIGGKQDERRHIRVLASAGEPRLGGIDWDAVLVDMIAESFIEEHGIDFREDPLIVRRIAAEAEKCKRTLSNDQRSQTEKRVTYQGREHVATLTCNDFMRRTLALVGKARRLTNSLLKSTDLDWNQVDRIIPVGGSVRLPMIRQLLREYEARGPKIQEIPPELSVAQGAALYAGCIQFRKSGADANQLAAGAFHEYATTFVTGNDLSVLIRDRNTKRRLKHLLVARNTPLPALSTVTLATAKADQRSVMVRIVEGNPNDGEHDPDVADAICHCVINELPHGLPADTLIDVELTCDPDGLLHVVARRRKGGETGAASIVYQ
jgi:molecular chaperone DnaK